MHKTTGALTLFIVYLHNKVVHHIETIMILVGVYSLLAATVVAIGEY